MSNPAKPRRIDPKAALQASARHLQRGDLDAAEQALKTVPNGPDALHLQGLIAHRRGDLDTAKSRLRKAVSKRPGLARFHNSLGVVFRELGETESARAALNRALRLRPRFPGAQYNLGLVHEARNDYQAALAAYEAACEQDPDMARAHHARGMVLQVMGHLDEAREAFQRALDIQPNYPEAHFHLAHARRAEQSNDTQVSRIDALLAQPDREPREAGWLHAARGKLMDDLGYYDQAFDAFRSANQTVTSNHDPEARDELARRLTRAFSAERLQSPTEAALSRNDRIFIVGMPRSGTTLLEAMMATHPDVEAGGERMELRAAFAEAAASNGLREPENWANAGEGQLRQAAALLHRHLDRPGAGRFLTDKLPGNLWYLGVVGLLMPRVPILFTWRDPRDVGLSCYFTRFEEGQGFSYDLYHCGREIRTARHLMEHWLTALPNPMAVVEYERLVTEPKATMHKVHSCCELEETGGGNGYQHGRRAVTTASNWQVRQGLYRRAIGRWRNYESRLGPLLDGLGPAVAETPARH